MIPFCYHFKHICNNTIESPVLDGILLIQRKKMLPFLDSISLYVFPYLKICVLQPFSYCLRLFENFTEVPFSLQGPFDGILAFSQGAALAHLLAALRQKGGLSITLCHVPVHKTCGCAQVLNASCTKKTLNLSIVFIQPHQLLSSSRFAEIDIAFKFLVLISCFGCNPPSRNGLSSVRVPDLPCLYVYGKTDKVSSRFHLV